MKKKGLGLNPLDNIIPNKNNEETALKSMKPLKSKSLKHLKFKDCEKLLISIRPEQLEFLERLLKKIMRQRSSEYKEERITKNTIVRTAIDILNEVENRIDTVNIPNESVLSVRIKSIFQTKEYMESEKFR